MTFVMVKQTMNSLKTLRTKKRFVTVNPLSSKAIDRFENIMQSFHSCAIEKETDDKYFLISINQKYHFWIQKNGNEHWEMIK